ncbi:MAG TPA: transposase, partial [Pilimelia sp.]|nr:transposase [Pilimelia sp.]
DDYARPYRPRTAATSHPTPPPGPAARPGAVGAPGAGAPTADRPAAHAPQEPPPARPGGRVRPPWQADDLPEPPSLRLVEPPPLDDTALAPGHVAATQRIDLRHRYADPAPAPLPPAPPIPEGIASDNDGDLLIFAATRSAWFTARDAAAADVSWSFDADTGWRAAEEAAQPAIGDETQAGLPKRVPKANLVPGSPVTEERPLRIVRDPSSIAAHTTGYFRGWRRGQEIGGYAVGGRPGRDSAGGWEFSRASHADDADPEAAGYR